MNEEIKEILKKTDIDAVSYGVIINYITNLQKENENLKSVMFTGRNYNEVLKSEQDYKQRNEKAIEWCECVVNAKYTADKLPNGTTTDMGYCLDLAEPLLNILQGGDE